MTSLEASKIVLMLLASYPQGERQSDETVRIYENLIVDLDYERTQRAVVRLIQTMKFLPSVAEIRACVSEMSGGLRKTGMEAWGDVVHAIRFVGSYRTPKFADPLVTYVVGCMGWKELCLGENEAALRARFIEAYEQISDRDHREHQVSNELRLAAPVRGLARLGQIAMGVPVLEAETFDVDQHDEFEPGVEPVKNRRLS